MSYIQDAVLALGETTFDIHLNERAFRRNVPASVWNYRLGGYQVLKKWLSYRRPRGAHRPHLRLSVMYGNVYGDGGQAENQQ